MLRHRQEAILKVDDIGGALNKAIPHILELAEKWTQKGSGWVFDRVETLWLDTARYQTLKSRSYIPLPVEVAKKKERLSSP